MSAPRMSSRLRLEKSDVNLISSRHGVQEMPNFVSKLPFKLKGKEPFKTLMKYAQMGVLKEGEKLQRRYQKEKFAFPTNPDFLWRIEFPFNPISSIIL